ncbi:hypothetical protein EB796_004397 [Bugula neritina]|uniref:Uncharacterized protein n=1 Tax=Bugula neritina TaxID=10212 RepID=A0A7J7KGE5_BUGNE|nr:hypothetical protein EB796_004397 [Bugula neritina]
MVLSVILAMASALLCITGVAFVTKLCSCSSEPEHSFDGDGRRSYVRSVPVVQYIPVPPESPVDPATAQLPKYKSLFGDAPPPSYEDIIKDPNTNSTEVTQTDGKTED